MRASVALLGVAWLVGACSLITDFPRLTGGTATDGGSGSDGGADAREGGLLDGGPFCASQRPSSMFCDDFDEETTLTPHWDDTKPGTVTIEKGVAVSPPGALFSSVPQGSPDCTYGTVSKTLKSMFHAAHASFWLRFEDHAELDKGQHVAAIYLDFQTDHFVRCQVILSAKPNGSDLMEQRVDALPDGGLTTTGQSHEFSAMSPATWHHLEIDYDLDANHLVGSVDGVNVIDAPLAVSCPKQAVPTTLQLGAYCVSGGSPSIAVRYDDVTFDAR